LFFYPQKKSFEISAISQDFFLPFLPFLWGTWMCWGVKGAATLSHVGHVNSVNSNPVSHITRCRVEMGLGKL
jgi:hypothetical protein